jgi:hypothetical protein
MLELETALASPLAHTKTAVSYVNLANTQLSSTSPFVCDHRHFFQFF